jgi:hypothetical protein
MPRREVQLSEKPRPPLPRPLEPSLVTAVREAGWEISPVGWAQRRLGEIAELRRQLERARAVAEGEPRGGDPPVTTGGSEDPVRAPAERADPTLTVN